MKNKELEIIKAFAELEGVDFEVSDMLGLILAIIPNRVEEQAMKDITRMKTRMGTWEWYVGMSAGDYDAVLNATFAKLDDVDFC